MKQFIKRGSLFILTMICFILMTSLLPADKAFAETNIEGISHIYDDAGLLSTSELKHLEDMCIKYGDKNDIDIMILTHDDSGAADAEIYIENFADEIEFEDGVILLVDMNNRDVMLQGYGISESKVTSDRAQTITDELASYLTNKDYVTAFEKYIVLTDKYMNYVPIYLRVWFQLIVALVIGAIVVGIMASNSGGKMTTGGNTYIDSDHSGLIGRRDDYIRTQITRVRKPSQNGGGGGVSAGGKSHSSGRSKF